MTGKESSAFILKLDSLLNIETYTTYNRQSVTIEDESLYKHTDSTFYSIFSEIDYQNNTKTLKRLDALMYRVAHQKMKL